ncbi:Protein priB [Termitomyces sp. T112]|nr:Protein priB [Termitomyces sp. T112]
MLSSQGRPGTENYKSTADSHDPARPSSSTFSPGQDTGPSSRRQLAAANPIDAWFLPPTHIASSSGPNRDIQAPAASIVSSSHMIGPTSTFYDPDAIAQGQGDSQSQYQQWIDAHGGQQNQNQHPHHQQSMHQHPVLHRSDSYQQQQQPQAYHQDFRHSLPTPDQYDYSHRQYPQTSHSRYVEPALAATSPQSGVVNSSTTPLDNSASFDPRTTAANPYASYFPHPSSATNVNAPVYTATPEPLYQQQQQISPQSNLSYGVQNVGFSSHQQPQSQAQTPSPPFISIQTNTTSFSGPFNSHPPPLSSHSSSLSPASDHWIKEVYNKSVVSNANITQLVNDTPAETKTSTNTSLKMPGSASSKVEDKIRRSSHTRRITASDNTPKAPVKRKRPKTDPTPPQKSRRADSISDSEYEEAENPFNSGGISVGMGGMGVVGGGSRTRLPGACTHCKKLKMKCDFPKGDNTCRRCKSGGHVCIVEGRKPRTAPNKREYLLAQIKQKDAIIESLLKQLHNPYIATPMSIASYRMATSPSDQNNKNILEWLDRLQASVRSAGGKAGPNAFKDLRNTNIEDDDSDAEDIHESRFGLVVPTDDDDSQTVGGEDITATNDKLSSLPDSDTPLGLIANLSLSNNKSRGKKDAKEIVAAEENLDDDDVGVANETYFMPGPATDLGIRATLIEQHSPPEILVHGLVTPEDVDALFDIFFQRVNPFISLLDPDLHTPASTFARCPFLFTVICAISSRYYVEKSEIYPIAMHFAKHSAANALIDGWKSVELCQAYILMSIYAVPARRWEEDRSWLYTGLAIRIATDLNLHQVSATKPQNEKEEREILNRTRVWMICSNLDRSTATQFGKPFTVKEDYIMRNAKEWYKKSQYNLSHDVHLCAYSALLRIMAKSHDEIFSDSSSPSGLNRRVDFRTVTMNHDIQLMSYQEEWTRRFSEDSDPNDAGCAFRCSLLPFLVAYSRLVVFSFGFQQAYQRGIQPGDNLYFDKCLDAAKSVIRNMVENLAPTGYMRYAPDGHFIFASFASAFLLKLLKPEFSSLLAKEQETEIFDLIGRLIQTLSSPEIAIDDRHTPKLYARFLAGLLSRHRRDGATVGRLHPHPPANNNSPSHDFAHSGTLPSTSTFSITSSQTSESPTQGSSFGSSSFQQNGKMDTTPIYQPEATFSSATGAIHFGSDVGVSGLGGSMSDEDMLATMQALKNPAWWENMMMPGFSWPEAASSPSSNGNSPPASYSQSSSYSPPASYPVQYHNVPSIGGMGMNIQTAQVGLY